VIAAARPNPSDADSEDLEEPLTEYGDIFVTKSDDNGRTDRMYHHIGMGETRPLHQPPRRLLLAKQADEGEIFEDMQRRGVIEESDTPSSSLVFLLRKKSGDLRFCVDYGNSGGSASYQLLPLRNTAEAT
jgi:hypothetical protein